MRLTTVSSIAVAAFALSNLAVAATPAAPATATAQAAPAGLSDRTNTKRDAATRAQTRDWAQIDTNRDHLISPEEMEAYLKANPGPLAGARS